MSELVQFVVLQRSEKWVVRSRELERAFGDRRKAIHCAVDLQMKAERTGSRRWYWPAPAAMSLHRFGPSARIPTRWQDPSLADLRRLRDPRSTVPGSTGPRRLSTGAAFTIRGGILNTICGGILKKRPLLFHGRERHARPNGLSREKTPGQGRGKG